MACALSEREIKRHAWSHLNKQQVGAYAEYFVKMEMTMYGFQVYDTEVDDRGIDFVARFESRPFIEVQVKSLRGSGYVFMQKDKFKLSSTLYLAFAMFTEGKEPDLYLIPSLVWIEHPSGLFVSRDFGGNLKSKPEWGLNLSAKNMDALKPYELLASIRKMIDQATSSHQGQAGVYRKTRHSGA
jgi:hypothetical protein